jgi:hypothetical protein
VQLLTVSSSIKNPPTPVGKIVDVGLETWVIFVLAAVAGSFATLYIGRLTQPSVGVNHPHR